MYRKLWLGTVGLIVLAFMLVFGTTPGGAQAGDYSYKIKVLSGLEPVEGAYVRMAGVGVALTDENGIATLDLSNATGRSQGQHLFRGPLYAAQKGKASGYVSDEYDLLRVEISSHDIGETPGERESSFVYGTQIIIKLNTLYMINIK